MEKVLEFLRVLDMLQDAGDGLRSASQYIHPATYSKAMSLLDELSDLEETILTDLESRDSTSRPNI